MLPHARTPTQKLQDSVDMHDISMHELLVLLRNVVHEINLRIDGLTPDGDDQGHQDYHRREQDREITERQDSRARKAQYWAGIRIGATALALVAIIAALYSVIPH